MTTSSKNCPQCGTELPTNAPAGLCPRCVMAMNMATETQFTGEVGPHGTRVLKTAPTPEELAAKFPQLEILELLGRGGMGAVYKVRQKELDRIVALKILPPGIGDDPAFAERFSREAKALAKLNHPNIVTLYEFGRADGLFFFLMEFVDGVNLRQLLDTSRVSSREALAIVPQICDALQFAHDHGIVHRDIKPDNILMDRRGRVKVADFGLAKLVGMDGRAGSPLPADGATTEDGAHGVTRPTSELTEAGKVMGTPQYMAPEQKDRPLEVDHRADIYALGVVFYQMLTGELPGKRIEAPSKKVQIDVRLDEIVLRALEKKPELRYQQASVFKTQVENVACSSDNASGLSEPSENHPDKFGARASSFQKMLNAPSIGLIVISSLSLLLLAVTIPVWVYGAFLSIAGKTADFPWMVVIPLALLMVGFNIVSLAGAWRMRQLRSHTLALTGSILFMLTPGLGLAAANACNIPPSVASTFLSVLLGFLFGAWSLIVLSRGDVREAFDRRHREKRRNEETKRKPSNETSARQQPTSHWLQRELVNKKTGARWTQMVLFATALLLFAMGMWKLTQFDLKPHELFFGVLLVCILTFLAVALGFLARSAPASEKEESSEPNNPPRTTGREILWGNIAMTISMVGIFLAVVLWRADQQTIGLAVLSTAFFIAWIFSFISWRIARKNPAGAWRFPAAPAGENSIDKIRRLITNWWIRQMKGMVWQLPLTVVVMLALVTFVIANFRMATDAASPEIPKGSFVMANRLARKFSSGDVIAYRHNDERRIARVTFVGPVNGELQIQRRNEPAESIAADSIIGKVIFNTRPEKRAESPQNGFRPVLERIVTDAIDFDTGILHGLPLPHPLGERDPARYEWFNGKESFPWMRQHGVDAVNGNHALMSANLQLLKLDEKDWDRISADELLRRLLAQNATDTFADGTHKTFGFKTREGRFGMLQTMENHFDPGTKVRYKLAAHNVSGEPWNRPTIPVSFSAKDNQDYPGSKAFREVFGHMMGDESASASSSQAFGPVIERVLPDPDNGGGKGNRETLILRTGERISTLDDAPKEQGGRLRALVASEGDLFAEYDDFVGKRWAFTTAGLKLSDFLTRQWDTATSADVNDALKVPTALQRVEHSGATLYLLPDGLLPLTLAFESRNAERGLLQITALNDNPHTVTIRYKLVSQNLNLHAEAWKFIKSSVNPHLIALHDALMSNNVTNALRAHEKLTTAIADYAKRFGTQAELPRVFGEKIVEMGPVLRSGNVKKARELRNEAERAFTPEYLARFARLAGHEDLARGYESENAVTGQEFVLGNSAWLLAGSNPKDYEISTDANMMHSGKSSVSLQSRIPNPTGFATLMQTFKANSFRGKRVRMSGYVRANNVTERAALWMRVDGEKGEPLAFDNMGDRPIQGTTDWTKYEIVLDVPASAHEIAFGILFNGRGQVWMSTVNFKSVGNDIPPTATDLPKAPQ